MKKTIPLAAVLAVMATFAACSKKPEAASEVTPPESAASTADTPPPAPAAAAAVRSLPEVSKAIKSGQYDNAVQTLIQIRPATAQMTDMERLQYQQAVRDATTALIGVKDRDPAANAAYEKLSRSATGR